jgi:hypothetical protein
MSRPPPPATGTVATSAAADPVDFEEMAVEQNRSPETQRLLGGTSLKLAFRQTGAQRLAGDISTGTFCPIVPLKFRKDIFAHFHNVAHPRVSGLPAGQGPPPHTPGSPAHPHPAATFFSPSCGFGGPVTVQ